MTKTDKIHKELCAIKVKGLSYKQIVKEFVAVMNKYKVPSHYKQKHNCYGGNPEYLIYCGFFAGLVENVLVMDLMLPKVITGKKK